MAGLKHDTDKRRWHSLPLEILEPLADLMEAGREKYGQFNCLEDFDNPDERFWNANMRHAAACQRNPLAIDPETGCYHEAARAFSSLMRIYHCRREQADKDGPIVEASAESSGYSVPPLDDGDDDPAVHVVPDRTSRATAGRVARPVQDVEPGRAYRGNVLCLECGKRWPLNSEQGRTVTRTGVCADCELRIKIQENSELFDRRHDEAMLAVTIAEQSWNKPVVVSHHDE